jgi:HlyD family secretion protein
MSSPSPNFSGSLTLYIYKLFRKKRGDDMPAKRLTPSLLILLLMTSTMAFAGCTKNPAEAETAESQIVTVQRGTLTIDITAAGNLALSKTENLAFEAAGYVNSITVKEGDTVTQGQVLAELDPSAWNDKINTLQSQLASAEQQLRSKQRSLKTAQDSLATAEINVTKAERQVTAKEFAVSQAEYSLQAAQNSLNQIADVKKAQDAVDEAENNLKFVKRVLNGELGGGWQTDYAYWVQAKTRAEEDLAQAQEALRQVLNGTSVNITSGVALQVAQAQLQVRQKQMDLEDARVAVEDARLAVRNAQSAVEDARLALEDARINLADAQKNVENARKALDEAVNTSLQVIAPFDGFVTRVNVSGGDEVQKGTIAVQIADPNKFEVKIPVNELDIFKVQAGLGAAVTANALPGVAFPAKVTHISPTATIQSGVVNYSVTVELQSLSSSPQEQTAPPSSTTPESSQPGRSQTQGRTFGGRSGTSRQSGASSFAGVPTIQLREGLTVTVSIIVAEEKDVLIVPIQAITRENQQSYVQVQNADGTVEKRRVRTGLTSGQSIQIIEGLNEGEKIIVPKVAATSSSSSSSQSRPPGGMMIPLAPGVRPR